MKRGGETVGMIGLANKEGGYDLADQEAVEALCVAIVESLGHKRADDALREHAVEQRKAMELMAGREKRMRELKHEIRTLRQQLVDAGMEPAADDPLAGGKETTS